MEEKTFNHKNGNGRKGIFSEVYADSFLDEQSLVLGENSDILNSRFYGSKADDCFVFNSTLEYSKIFATLLINSRVENSELDCEYVAASLVYNSRISGESKIKNAHLNNVYIKNVTIDDARLYNIGTFDAPVDFRHGYITGGTWNAPPRTLRIEAKNVTYTEAENGMMHANCKKFSTRDWIKKARHYARIYRLDNTELEQAVAFAEMLII